MDGKGDLMVVQKQVDLWLALVGVWQSSRCQEMVGFHCYKVEIETYVRWYKNIINL